jgi:O-antigen/teichoic acid export membrane protein
VKEIVSYGKWVLLSSILFVLASNGDRLLLGAWVDAATLGLYSLALNLAMIVDGAGGKLFAAVAMPALSEVARETPDRFRAVYFRMRLPFDLGFVGCAGLLFAAGQLVVDVLYDPRYQAAGHILQLLSFSLVFSRFGFAGSAYLALGAPRALMWIHIVKLLSIFILVPTMYTFFGLNGAFLAIAMHPLPTLPLMYYLNRRHNLNDVRFELLTFAAWPVGYAFGWMVVLALGPLLGDA